LSNKGDLLAIRLDMGFSLIQGIIQLFEYST